LLIKKVGSQLLGRRERWDFLVPRGKGDWVWVEGFSARLWNKKHTAIV